MMKKSKSIAFSGIVACLSVAVTYIGNLIPVMKFIAPIISGLFLISICYFIDLKNALITYIAVSLLLIFLSPSKISALSYILIFGYYPVLYQKFEKIKLKIVKYITKFVLFNLVGLISFIVAVQFFISESVYEKYKKYIVLGVVLFNIFFMIYETFIMIIYKKLSTISSSRVSKLLK
jgi:hypothetical protein